MQCFYRPKKAFNTVHHSVLLNKLEHYGIKGTALKWFTSYLTDRQQDVSVNGHCSNYLSITCGVPKGYVLGPLLFLIHINPIRPGLFSRSSGPKGVGGLEARTPKIKVNINQLK